MVRECARWSESLVSFWSCGWCTLCCLLVPSRHHLALSCKYLKLYSLNYDYNRGHWIWPGGDGGGEMARRIDDALQLW